MSQVIIQYCLMGFLLTCSVAMGDHAISANDAISAANDGQKMEPRRQFFLHDGKDPFDDAEPMIRLRSDMEESFAYQAARVRYNVLHEGAVGDGVTNDTKAFLAAWSKACQVNNSAVHAPSGYNYLVYPSTYSGPCQGDIQFQVEGTILAPAEISGWDGKNVKYWFLFQNLNGFALTGKGTFNGRGQNWWACRRNGTCPVAPTSVSIFKSNNVPVKSITLVDSPQIHINFQYINLGIVKSIKIQAPSSSPNTDGIHVAFTTNFAIQDCNVSTGDDCVSIVTGSHNIAVQNTYCGIGCHGISVGSLGANGENANVSQVLVKNCQLESTTNGLRIKTWQGGTGIARNLRFMNIKMTNVSNPILIDQYYCPSSQSGPCSNQSHAVGIDLIKFVNITGTSATSTAVELACSEAMPCRDIRMTDINITQMSGKIAGSACINAFGVAGGMQSPPSCLATKSLSNFTPLTLYLANFNAILHELRGIFYT